MIDISQIMEENRSMKYLTLSLLILAAAISVDVKAQSGPLEDFGNNSCAQNNPGIITPPKHIDFKIIVIVPPKHFDQAMVVNPCSGETETTCAPQAVIPRRNTNPFFKAPPFKIKKRYSK